MKRLTCILTIALTGSITTVFSQHTFLSKFAVGITVAPEIAYRHITLMEEENPSVTKQQWDSFKQFEDSVFIPRFGYSARLSATYAFHPRFRIETGAGITMQGFGSHPISILYSLNAQPEKGQVRYNFTTLDIPLLLHASLTTGKWQLTANAGGILLLPLSTTATLIPETSKPGFERKTTDMSSYVSTNPLVAVTAGCGVEYNLNNHVLLKAIPSFRYTVNGQSDMGNLFHVHLWSAGINFGCFYRFSAN